MFISPLLVGFRSYVERAAFGATSICNVYQGICFKQAFIYNQNPFIVIFDLCSKKGFVWICDSGSVCIYRAV